MKVAREIKKIVVSNNLEDATLTVEFNISDHEKLEEFKNELDRFVNKLEGQQELLQE